MLIIKSFLSLELSCAPVSILLLYSARLLATEDRDVAAGKYLLRL